MKRLLKMSGVLVGLIVVGAAALFISVFAGKAPIPDGMQLDGVQVVKDGYVSVYVLDLAPGEVALVDAGNAPDAAPILAALKQKGLGPTAVKAILLTHGDRDHTAGAHLFPDATVMALAPDVELAEGKEGRGLLQSPEPTGLHVGRVLHDGDVIEMGGTHIEVFAIPGHTPGSAAYLARGVLFLGDSAEVNKDGALETAMWLFCADRPLNRQSLRRLTQRLAPRAGEVKAIACSHSGVLEDGIAPLVALADRLAGDS